MQAVKKRFNKFNNYLKRALFVKRFLLFFKLNETLKSYGRFYLKPVNYGSDISTIT